MNTLSSSDAIGPTILRLKRLRTLITRARALLRSAWVATSICAQAIADTPERYAAAPWRPRSRFSITRDTAQEDRNRKFFFYFSGSQSFDSLDHQWALGCGILRRNEAPANPDLGERALLAQWHWEHCAQRVNALIATYESEFRKAVET